MKRIFLSFIFCLLIVFSAFAQKKSEIKDKFVEAESWFLFEEYQDALPLYEELLKIDSTNANINYRTGVCYLNIPGEKHRAITFLEKAIQNINPKYKEGNYRETRAPIDAYFYLGNAYRINNMLEKAIDTYEYFKQNMDEKVYEVSVVDHQINACKNALKLQASPVFLDFVNLGETINTRFRDFNPVVSGDANTIAYTQTSQFGQDMVFFSVKENGLWSPPYNMTFDLGAEDLKTASLSYDGKTLYLYKLDDYDGNIYLSRFEDGTWTKIEKLNDNINTKFWESHASESKDGNSLYFTSNRKDTYGGLDIYVSQRDSTGEWGPATNLGENVNTIYNEEAPFLSADGKTLYFSSYGHFNIGGYDIFYSSLFDNNEWSPPLNMGYPINTPDDDVFYVPVGEGYYAYYSLYSDSGYGMEDIFLLEIYSIEHPRKFLIRGIVSLGAVSPDLYETISIHVLDTDKKDTVTTVQPTNTGDYEFIIGAGEYDLHYKGEGFDPVLEHLSLPMSLTDSIFVVDHTLMTLNDVTAALAFMDSIFDVNAGDTIAIDLMVEPGAILMVTAYDDTTRISSEEFAMYDSVFTYNYVPEPGENALTFTLTDKYGNITSKDLLISAPIVATILPEAPDTIPAELVAPFIISDEVLEFRNRLSYYATGNLKTTIDDVDLQAAEIASPEVMITHLKDVAQGHGYSPADVDALLLLAAARSADAEDFKHTLKGHTRPPLETILDTMSLDLQDISDPSELLAFLQGLVAEGVITQEELDEAIAGLVISEDPSLNKIRAQLDSIAQGDLKEVLKELKPEKEQIYSTYELINFLSEKASILGYTEEELAILLSKLAANGNPDVDDFIVRFLNYTDGSLKETLENINLKKERIKTISDLIRYLLSVSVEKGYSSADLMNALIDMIADTDIDMEKVRELIDAEDIKRVSPFGVTAIILGVLGMFTLLFLFWRRHKRKQE